MLVDSHCHLNMLDLSDFDNTLQNVIDAAHENDVRLFLCVSVKFDDHKILSDIASRYPDVYFSVGVQLAVLGENHSPHPPQEALWRAPTGEWTPHP